MNVLNELEALLILSRLAYLGSIKIRFLIQHYGSACAALQAPLDEIASFPGFGHKVVQAWKEREKQCQEARKELELSERMHVQLIPFTHPAYPKRLLEIEDHPLILYLQGTLLQRDQRCLAVVGTRNASLYGQEMARQLSHELAQAGFTIVSGLARGIDTAAHHGALEAGRTLAVLGSGLTHLYPHENKNLAHAISQQGALLSEFSLHIPPERFRFPKRNRLVSGLTLGTLLIEAPVKSGAMLTVERALEQGRPVFTIPGRIDQDSFKGNHCLIKQHRAKLVENVQDILTYFEDNSFFLPLTSSKEALFLEKEEEELLRRLPVQELSIEAIVQQTGWPVAKLNVLLMSLVLKKVIKEYPGKIYRKI